MMDEIILMPTKTNMTNYISSTTSSPPTKPKPQSNQILRCPRCDSTNTKFCYYNNYSLSQPRHLCKACKRYWTRGGTLRNVPVGGGCRKNKRIKKSSVSVSAATTTTVSTYPAIISFNLDTFNSFLFGLPPPSDQPSTTSAANFASYSQQPCNLGIDTGEFQLGFDYPALLTYQNLQNSPGEVKVSNFVMDPFEALAGSADYSYLYGNSAVMGSTSAAWADVTNSSIAPLI